ncbi:hypothetical protein PIB30_053423 [Stylosanthes scabra]|uniref:Uncharacterized protein n=1 Tax=Stylosanthes scabra TaxID=79078 RepID=A0ABU6YHC5_9FABA|nr:hypothetical protein [Stylosanthes scabra]
MARKGKEAAATSTPSRSRTTKNSSRGRNDGFSANRFDSQIHYDRWKIVENRGEFCANFSTDHQDTVPVFVGDVFYEVQQEEQQQPPLAASEIPSTSAQHLSEPSLQEIMRHLEWQERLLLMRFLERNHEVTEEEEVKQRKVTWIEPQSNPGSKLGHVWT